MDSAGAKLYHDHWQCCSGQVGGTTEGEPTVTIDGRMSMGERQLTEGVMNTASDRSGERLTDVVSKVLLTVDCGRLGHAVVRWRPWRGGLARAAQQQLPQLQLTKREMKRLLKGKTKVKRGRERGLAHYRI